MKKFTIFFTLLVVMATTAIADNIQVSTSTSNPEHRYTMKNGNNLFANSNTAPTQTEDNYGHFAFFAVAGVENAYYIYSIKAGKYLSYDKADSYKNEMNKVTLVDSREHYFSIVKCASDTTFYELHPYNNSGVDGKYLNWFGGVDNNQFYHYDAGTLGLWEQGGNDDPGSRFYFTDIYSPKYTGERNGNYANRFITNIALNEDNLAIDDTEQTQFYVDKTADMTFTVKVGDTIRINLTTDASWMHSYIYIDQDNNGFTAQLNSDGSPIGDLVAYSYYNNRNSLGESATEGGSLNSIPKFTAPTEHGIYRMRYKMDWNDIAPNGNSGFQSNSGFMVDFLLEVQSIASRTITVTTETADCVVKANNTIGGVTTNEVVEITAEPAFGYKFVEWQLNGNVVSTDAIYTDNTDGDKTYVAVFRKFTAEEQYETIAKPTFAERGNITNITSATISAGNGIANYSSNIIPADLIPSNTDSNTRQQAGRTEFIPVAKGATFNLNIEYNTAWDDLTLVKFVQGNTEKLCGPFDGKWPNYGGDKMLENVAAAGYERNGNTITFPITIDENLDNGDIIVIRSIIAKEDVMNTSSYSEGSYVDFCFVIGGYDLNVSSAGYATLYLNCNAIIPEDVEAYIATSNNSTTIFMEQITGILPANTGVIIKADPNTYRFQYTAEDAPVISKNLLAGTAVATYINEDAYVLSNQGGKEIGFYKATKNKDEHGNSGNTHFLNNANKVYLPSSALTSTAQLSNGFKFNFDGTTAIEEVKGAEEKVEGIYDLTGRKLDDFNGAGIYIVNGKKVIK